jgi:hypothetical protein
MNSSKRFSCDVMFHNEHMFDPAQLSRSWYEQRPRNQGEVNSIVTGEILRVDYTEVDQLLGSFLYRSILFIEMHYNGRPVIRFKKY